MDTTKGEPVTGMGPTPQAANAEVARKMKQQAEARALRNQQPVRENLPPPIIGVRG